MKIKLIIAIGLLALSHYCFSGVIFNKVLVNVTLEGINGTLDKNNFTVTFAGTNKKDNYPTFRKTIYGWFRQRKDLIDQEGTLPELTRKFIPSGQDTFTFSTDKMDDYLQAIDTIIPQNAQAKQTTAHYASLIKKLKEELSYALFDANALYRLFMSEKINKLINEAFSRITAAPPMQNKRYNLYDANVNTISLSWIPPIIRKMVSRVMVPGGNDALTELIRQRYIAEWTYNAYATYVEKADIKEQGTMKRIAQAYLAIQKFCNALGITTPSITSYTGILKNDSATLAGTYL